MTVIHDHYTPPIGTTTEGTIHFRSPHNRDTNGKTLTTEQSERALVDSAFSVDLPPGQLQVKLDIPGGTTRSKWWDIEVPEAGPARLLDLIAIGVNIPPQTTIEKFDEAVARLVESGSTAILTQTEADAAFAPIDDPRFDEIGGASDADVAAIVTDPTSQTKTSLDATYVRTVNGTPVDPTGNVAVEGGGLTFVDNGDGTVTLDDGGSSVLVDNGDGTATLTIGA